MGEVFCLPVRNFSFTGLSWEISQAYIAVGAAGADVGSGAGVVGVAGVVGSSVMLVSFFCNLQD